MKPDNFANRIDHIAFLLARHSDQVLQEQLGIGYSQYKIMSIIQNATNLQQKQIADKLSQTEASISRQVKLSESQMLLRVYINPKNKREHLISLTPKGERLTLEADNILESFHSTVFDKLSVKQKDALDKLLTDILFNLLGKV